MACLDHIRSHTRLTAVDDAPAQEAVRMFPPLIMVMRYVKETFSVKDSSGRQFVIPKVHAHLFPASHVG